MDHSNSISSLTNISHIANFSHGHLCKPSHALNTHLLVLHLSRNGIKSM